MHCTECGAALPKDSRYCPSCGHNQAAPPGVAEEAISKTDARGSIGFSRRINDPAFARYVHNSNRWAAIFSIILAVVAVVGFTMAGEMGGGNMENPQAFFIGLGVGGMFLVIALFQIAGRNRSKTWDGQVVDKKVLQKKRKRSSGTDDYYWEKYQLYTVVIRSDSGKLHRISAENSDTVYNYYQIGDKVRHHAGLNSYEKYDKSQDSIIFCNACSTLNDISADYCSRCKCPLLK